ncbi:hypothetical protein [Nocardia sienata]|uniref:hypothetical protein n=1 Tax=Nocardia sienata TaxID=248552 RepID=UPI00350E34ED
MADIPPGGEITRSNNPANRVRPLLGPAAAGLIVLKGGAGWDSRIEDVDTAASRVRLTPMPTMSSTPTIRSVRNWPSTSISSPPEPRTRATRRCWPWPSCTTIPP